MPGARSRRLLGVGYATPGYGFGRVFRSLYPHLAADWEIEHLEFSPPAPQVLDAPWRVHVTTRPAFHFGHLEFADLLESVRPEVVLCSLDVWQLPPYLLAAAQASWRPRVVAYCPVDAPLAEQHDLSRLADLDALAVPTRFGAAMAVAALDRQGVALPRPVAVIPHGVDADRFRPVDGRLARRVLFPREPGLEQGFLVLNANRNQLRKRLDLTLEGFAQFAAGKPADVRLLLHSGTIDLGSSTEAVAHELGVLDRVLRIRHDRGHPVVDDEQLNLIYNAAAVGVNTCTSEGWGLIAFEHAATGAAQIVPQHSACGELWSGAADVLPATPLRVDAGNVAGGQVRAADLAAALERLYRDPAHLAAQAAAARERAMRPELRWDAVAARFDGLLREVLG